MRRILLVVAILLIAVPAMAAVTITATSGTKYTADGKVQLPVRIRYSTDVTVRAFALDVNVDNGATIRLIHDFNVGDNNGHGIFPGKFRDVINPTSPSWTDPCYNPIAPAGDAGAGGTGLNTVKIITEQGSLYTAGHAPGLTGTLYIIDVNSNGAKDCNLTVAADSIRGTVIDESGNLMATNLPVTVKLTLTIPCNCPGNVAGATPSSLPVNTQVDVADATTIVQWIQAYGNRGKIACPWAGPPSWVDDGCGCPGNVAGATPSSLPVNTQVDVADATTIVQWIQAYGNRGKIACPWAGPPGW